MAETRASKAIQVWLKSGTPEDPHTQEGLAERLGSRVGRDVNQSTVSQIARGLQQPRADLVVAFRDVLGIEPEWWLPPRRRSSRPTLKTGTDGR